MIAVLATLLVIFMAVYVWRARKTNGAELVSERAEVRWKKQYARTEAHLRAYVDCVVCFRTADGETFECQVEQQVYRNLSEGDSGILKHRGSQFRTFSLDNGETLQD